LQALSQQEIQAYLTKLHTLPHAEQLEIKNRLDEIDAARSRQTSQGNFMGFVKKLWPEFIHGKHHNITAQAFQDVVLGDSRRVIINMPPRHRLAVDTPIPTQSGWKTMETVQEGDVVFGVDGQAVRVTGKSDIAMNEELFAVETRDGQVIECDGDHLWTVRFTGGGGGRLKTYSTREILEKLETGSWVRFSNYPRLPDVGPAAYKTADLPIDPYVLGAWLGDGASRCGAMAAHPEDAPHIRARFERAGIPTTDLSHDKIFGTRGLMVKLREVGVLNDKHIPEAYLTAARHQRLYLMQGLMDTDGSVGADGKCVFYTSIQHLAEQFLELVHSFGVRARITTRDASYQGKPGKLAYRINFKMLDAASLPRKAERTRNAKTNNGRTIRVYRTGRRGPVQCLQVDNEDGLFLAGKGYVCTHNTKSEFASKFLVAWALGHHPTWKIIQSSNTAELATGFGRQVRNIVDSKEFKEVFPGVGLDKDSTAAGRWATNKGGEYFAIGTGGTVSGRGGDLVIIDDPHSEQEARLAETNPEIFDSVYEWYTSGPRQRLQPGGRIVIVMTRWGLKDLTGRVTKSSATREGSNEWRVIELPALLDGDRPIWPEYWSQEELLALKAELPVGKWNAQYQQRPTAEEGALVKREWWQEWKRKDPPKIQYMIQSWDTAFEKTQRSDYSACTTWGVFFQESKETGKMASNLILLDAFKKRMEFPELKKVALEEFRARDPDTLLVEKKASGAPLIYELRAMGIPVSEFTPTRGNDKIARVNAVSDLFQSGVVWAPPTRWAEEVIEEFAAFPMGEHDDLVDSSTQALLRYRQGGFIQVPSDDYDEMTDTDQHRRADYY
tara:strand:+ start:1317 stop:3830 length:2514 start_codon:yes stop_codon:yes gene_type:complete